MGHTAQLNLVTSPTFRWECLCMSIWWLQEITSIVVACWMYMSNVLRHAARCTYPRSAHETGNHTTTQPEVDLVFNTHACISRIYIIEQDISSTSNIQRWIWCGFVSASQFLCKSIGNPKIVPWFWLGGNQGGGWMLHTHNTPYYTRIIHYIIQHSTVHYARIIHNTIHA